jgi:hypothetical protein
MVARGWSRLAECLAIVQPATVIAWRRRGFARWWAWRSRPVGRPPLAPELTSLIEQMSRENPLWSRRRIASELAKLGHAVDKGTVAKYMPKPAPRPGPPPSQTRALPGIHSGAQLKHRVDDGVGHPAAGLSPVFIPAPN